MLLRMTCIAPRIPQPGRTGNPKVLGTVKAARRTILSVGPIGHRSVAAASRNDGLPLWSSALCIFAPVSVGLRTIETGAARLAQRQALRAFAPNDVDAKVRKSASTAAPSPKDVAARV